MNANKSLSQLTVGYVGGEIPVARDQTYVESRVDTLTVILAEISTALSDISDRMEGAPEAKSASVGNIRSGWMGGLEDLLEMAQSIRGKVSYLSDKI